MLQGVGDEPLHGGESRRLAGRRLQTREVQAGQLQLGPQGEAQLPVEGGLGPGGIELGLGQVLAGGEGLRPGLQEVGLGGSPLAGPQFRLGQDRLGLAQGLGAPRHGGPGLQELEVAVQNRLGHILAGFGQRPLRLPEGLLGLADRLRGGASQEGLEGQALIEGQADGPGALLALPDGVPAGQPRLGPVGHARLAPGKLRFR